MNMKSMLNKIISLLLALSFMAYGGGMNCQTKVSDREMLEDHSCCDSKEVMTQDYAEEIDALPWVCDCPEYQTLSSVEENHQIENSKSISVINDGAMDFSFYLDELVLTKYPNGPPGQYSRATFLVLESLLI